MGQPTFTVSDGLHINLVSEDNPLFPPGKECYFLLCNVDDIHRPLIVQGTILDTQYLDGIINQQYVIRTEFVCESEETKERFYYDNIFRMCSLSMSGGYTDGKPVLMRKNELEMINRKMFHRVDAFFVRETYDKIFAFRKEYLTYVRSKMLEEIGEIEDCLVQGK